MVAEAMVSQPGMLGNRYVVQDQLGAGGMGVVYRTLDRLTGGIIALKRLTIPGNQLDFESRTSMTDTDDIRLILAQEFRMLASLRHPHIISVLDYGFDADSQPYFTMELLEAAQSLVDAGQHASLQNQITLLNQALQALAYLHRRGVFHRDLKPENVQVIDHGVKVLDFGLAVSREVAGQEDGLSGTLPYMAPELFDGDPVSDKSDLYAVGVMAYEIFAGTHPFDYRDLDIFTFTDEVQNRLPDVAILPVPDAVQDVVARLMAKDPADRYDSANDALIAFSEAAGVPIPPETIAIRDSYLQAAQFVGREAEVERLNEALSTIKQGQGSTWLLGGESGVGKSRLLHEVRTRALVQGALVMQGEANETGGQAYQVFQGIFRRLALLSEPNALEASVLKVVVPGIADLLGHEIADAPALDPDSARLRLFSVVTELLRRVQRPMMIILENLHWASHETLDLLKWISQRVADLPILLVGSYRIDDKPRLPDVLPAMQLMNLRRLSKEEITTLSVSMLGRRGANPEVIDLLQRETEGNVYFMVEVVRALAEEAGQLEKIGQSELPEQVFAWEIQAIIQRRLDRVSEKDRSLLDYAAIAGRELDLAVLKTLAPAQELDRWLTNCSEIAVLEVIDDRWRFTHDKLHETALAHLAADERSTMHQQVATAIENTYETLGDHASTLVYHWAQAGNTEKECKYSLLAGREMAKRYANADAIQYLQRALDLAADNKIAIMYEMARIWETSSQWDDAEQMIRQAIELTVTGAEEECTMAWCHSFLGNLLISLKGDYNEGFAHLQQASTIFESVEEWKGLIEANLIKGRALVSQGEVAKGLAILEKQHGFAVEVGDSFGATTALRNIGHVYSQQADHDRALAYYQQSLELALEIDDLKSISTNYSSLGVLFANLGNLSRALEYYSLQLENFKKMGDVDNFNETIISIGNLYMMMGEYDTAVGCCEQGVKNSVQTGHYLGCSIGLIYLAECYVNQGRFSEAMRVGQLAVAIVRNLQKMYHLAGYLAISADVHYDSGDYATAQQLSHEAIDLADQLNSRHYLLQAQIMDVRLRFALDSIDKSAAIQELAAMVSESSSPEVQAGLYYVIWTIDAGQHEAREAALRLCRDLYHESPQIRYRERCEAMGEMSLPAQLALPPLPESINLEPIDLLPSLQQIEHWLDGE